jgi:hypothetical protein
MKKLLGLLVVLAVALPASADVLKNVEIKGEIQTIASDVNHNEVDGDPITPADIYNAGTGYRVLAGLSANLVEDVTANLTFQQADMWNGAIAGDSYLIHEGNTALAEANVVLSNLFDCFEATVGRQFYGEEDSAVMYFGPNHYNAEGMYAPSLDAAKLTYADDAKALTVIAGKLNLNNAALGLDANTFAGADFRMNLTDAVKLQAYLYDFNDINDGVNPVKRYSGFYGAKLSFAPEAFLLSAEYARNFGGHKFLKEEGKATRGYMVKVDGAMNVEAVKVRGAFLYETEDFWAFGNYTPGLLIGHVFGGQTNLYSVEGVRMFNVGIDVNPFEKWTFSLDGYSFQDRFGHHSATFEGDLVAKYQHNEYVQLFAGFGYAKYGTNEPMNAPAGVTYKGYLHKDNFKGQLGMLINF